MTLSGWQEKLSTYFAAMRIALDAVGNLRPIFAIEHGLTEEELAALVISLREHTESSGPSARHYHAWSVYAAEVGYKFKGDEYWQTFAAQLPAWRKDDNDCIKDAFWAFKKQFRGAVPSGNWAKNFTIISWPITHAVLSKDLQRHLANVLYDVRGAFTQDLLKDTVSFGKLIAANSEGKSSRFRKFAEEHELVGRISIALLSPESEDTAGLLAPHTLKRIIADLQAEQNALAWLTSARQQATSVKLKGLKNRGVASLGSPTTSPEIATQRYIEPRQERLEPMLKQVGQEIWSVIGLFPNLSHISAQKSEFQRVFTSQRSFVDVSGKSHFAPRYFAINRQEIALKSWPYPNESLLRFDPSPAGLSDLLNDVCSLPPISTTLFRLRDDGSGTLVKSKSVRPGETYLLLSPAPFPQTAHTSGSKPVTIDCEGTFGLLLDVPDRITDAYQTSLKSFGLNQSLSLHVDPAGYPPKSWNADGEIEWTEGSPKLLAISSTIEIKNLVLNLNGGATPGVMQTNVHGEGPIYVDFEALSPGQYELHLAAQVASADDRVVTGYLSISVVPDDQVVLTAESAPGFSILAAPALPTMEEVWEDTARINIYGPRDSTLRAQLTFYPDSAGLAPPILTYPIGKFLLPVGENDWSIALSRAKKDKKVLSAREDAVSCRMSWRSLELGEASILCEREFVPFRWSVRTRSNHRKLRLILNDSIKNLRILRASFDAPALLQPFDLNAQLEYEQSDEGGLFAARSDFASSCIILGSPSHHGFGALKPSVKRIQAARDEASLHRLCEAFLLWTETDATEDALLSLKRNAAVDVLQAAVLESVCGGPWVSAEVGVVERRLRVDQLCGMVGQAKDYKFERSLSEAVRVAVSLTTEELISVAIDLTRSANAIQNEPAEHQTLLKLVNLLQRVSPGDHPWMEFTGDDCRYLLAESVLVKASRLLVIAKQQQSKQTSKTGWVQ